MGETKLYLLLLLSAVPLSYAQDEEFPCLLAQRYKSFQKYEYTYETESLNALNQAINGPKAKCKVEIEVPRICSYIVHTTDCELSEVTDVDAEGKPVFGPSAAADSFKAAMAKNPLKFTVEGDDDIKLFPEYDEQANILNFKRGLISALAAPVLEENKNRRMPTIYGMCKTDYTVNARQDIATDVVLNRDLSRCDNFSPVKDHTSPLAIITGLRYPLTQLIRSSQTCNYKFDNEQKHMTSVSCSENHLVIPFSHKGQHGVTNAGKQVLTLEGVSVYNGRTFEHNESNMKTLHLDGSIDSVHPIQDKEPFLSTLRELNGLSETNNGHNRAHLANELISTIRKMSAESLSAALPEALEISRPLVYQALFQCGTLECTSSILRVLRTFDKSSVEIDAAVYALGMVPNPSEDIVEEMLEMAKFKPSKPIFYALSNAVRRLYESEGRVTPEIKAVADFAAEQIGDCTGNQEHVYLSLRVIGNMAAAVGAASPALKSAVIQCINQAGASAQVQQAAIQVFRLTSVPDENRDVFVQAIFDEAAPIQKRIAAYLIVMKNPQPFELPKLLEALGKHKNCQAMSFINSHLRNIVTSTSPETEDVRHKIVVGLNGDKVITSTNQPKFSRYYKIGSLEGNVIFESEELLPNEVILEMTMNAFGYDIDMFEIGLNGKGLEPTVDALIGIDGFFRDTMQKTINFAADKVPSGNEIMQRTFPTLWKNIKLQEAPENIVKEITNNVNKLIQKLKDQDNPEAMIYLRLLGAELGYLKTKDVEDMAYSVAMVAKNLIHMFPTDFIRNFFSSINNDLFLHYVFMDNEFYLPTGTGVPLRVALSGTFAPGVKGGLKIGRDMSEAAFMPSAGVEIVTEVGAILPGYVESGLEMHTNIYHESGLKVKVAITNKQLQMTFPTPQTPTKLISVTNSLFSVKGTETKYIPPLKDEVKAKRCAPFIPGFQYCGSMQYSNAYNSDVAPYFPLTGNSKFEIEMHPTGEVSEYTATVNYAFEDPVDSVTFGLKAEGSSFEGKMKLMFDRQNYGISADFRVPDYDMEAGIRVQAVDRKSETGATHSIQIDFMNKNVAEASIIGGAKFESMKDAMLLVQLLVPNFQTNAKVSATVKHTDELTLQLESDISLPEMTKSIQKVILKYDPEEIEAEIFSDISTELHKMIPFDAIKNAFNVLLDQEMSDMKIRDVVIKSVETSNNYMEQLSANIPYFQNFRIPDMPEFNFPERLFFNTEAAAKYKFGQDYYTIMIPIPYGGKSSRDFNIPPVLATPNLRVHQLDLEVASINIPLPEVFVPERVSVSLPLVAKLEVSSKMKSNLYEMEGSASIGRELVETPKVSAKIEVIGTSQVELLSFKVEGSAVMEGTPGESIKGEIKSSLNHKLIEASINFAEEITASEKITMKTSSKIEANSPFGLKVSMEHTGQTGMDADEISGDGHLLGSIKVGPLSSEVALRQSLIIQPFKPEMKIDSSLKVDSDYFQAGNKLDVAFANGEFSITSKTSAFEDNLKHEAEFTYKEAQVTLKSDTQANGLGMNLKNVAEARANLNSVNIKIDNNVATAAAGFENPIRSQFTAVLDVTGLNVKSENYADLAKHTASHECSLSLNRNGLNTQGTTKMECPILPMTFENKFTGALDTSALSFSVETKSKVAGVTVDNSNSLSASLSSVTFTSTAVSNDETYKHDFSLQIEPYSASVKFSNDLNALNIKLINEAQFKAVPYTADLTGSWKLSSGADELKHTYQIRYEDLVATAKCGITGKLMGSHMSHDTEVEVAGLSVTFGSNSRFNSQYLRYDGNFHATAVPFKFNVDAMANTDGDLFFYGKQSAQAYSKFLMKAEPFAFAHSHEYRVSTTHNLDNGLSFETNLDNKVDTVMTPSEQKASIRVKSKLNNHEFNQDASVYNIPERIGAEMSGSFITSIFNTASSDNQDHFFSAFVKYDKSTHSHILSLPFIDSIPEGLEHMKIAILRVVETIQQYINKEEVVAEIQKMAQHIGGFVNDLDIETKMANIKENMMAFYEKYGVTLDDLEASLMNLKPTLLKVVTELDNHVEEIEKLVREIIASGTSDAAIQKLTETLNAFNEKYDIKAMVLAVIEAIENAIDHVEKQYAIKSKVEGIVNELKQFVSNFDQGKFTEEVKNFVNSVQFREYADKLVAHIPTEEIRKIIGQAKELLTIMGSRMEVVYNNMRDILVRSGIDKKIETLLNNIVELIKKFNVEKTLTTLITKLRTFIEPVNEVLEKAINYLKTTEVKDMIEDFNNCLNHCVNYVRSFDYNAFVDEVNKSIHPLIKELQLMCSSFEIREKLEAIREFLNFALRSIHSCIEELKTVTFVDVAKQIKEIVDKTILIDSEALVDSLKKTLADMDIKSQIEQVLNHMKRVYTEAVALATHTCNALMEILHNAIKDQRVVEELKQFCDQVKTALTTAELEIPSFTIPLTNLLVPSTKISLESLQDFSLPEKLVDLPGFTVLQYYEVPPIKIEYDDVKQRLLDLLSFIANFDIIPYVETTFGNLRILYMPDIPAITIPELNFNEISLPEIPKYMTKHKFSDLQIPDFTLPKVPGEIFFPCFGKLYGEVRFTIPIFNMRTTMEFMNSTETAETPQFVGHFTSHGSSEYDILKYNLDSTARVAMPKMSRVVLAETLKIVHSFLTVDHQSSVSLYGFSAQASSKSTMKITSATYNANIVNMAFFALEDGMSANVKTTYSDKLSSENFNSEFSYTNDINLKQEGLQLLLNVEEDAKGQMSLFEKSDDITAKSASSIIITPTTFKLTMSADTNSNYGKVKQIVNAEGLSYFDFNVNIDRSYDSDFFKLDALGKANLREMKVEMKADLDTKYAGLFSGTQTSGFNFFARPFEMALDFNNKVNNKLSIGETLSAKIDAVNNYTVILNSDEQKMSTVVIARFNQYKYSHNFTAVNNEDEMGIYTALNGEANLEFLNTQFDIPSMNWGIIVAIIETPEITNINLYEQTGLKHVLTDFDQAIDMDAKIVYQKSDLVSEVSFKSSILSLNGNAGFYGKDNPVIRFGVTTTSEFESLKAKLEGTSSLSTKSGIKLANSLVLGNRHIEGTHESTFTINPLNFEAALSMSSAAKVTLPILTATVNHQLTADNKAHPKADSTFKMDYTFDIPIVKLIGKGNAETVVKGEATLTFISAETLIKGTMDGTFLDIGTAKGAWNHEESIYINGNSLRGGLKTISDSKLSYGDLLLSFDVDENLTVESAIEHVYAVLKLTSNNEANIGTFNTKGAYVGQATADLDLMKSLVANMKADFAQPSTFGDLSLSETLTLDISVPKQNVAYTLAFISPVYNTDITAKLDGSVPTYKTVLKAAATSPISLLKYEFDSSMSSTMEDGALVLGANAVFTHLDFNMDISNAIRMSEPSHTLNVDITSPAFTDATLRYTARTDGISGSVSTPSTGQLGFQLQANVPSQMSGKIYRRYDSAPEDIEIVSFRVVPKGNGKVLLVSYNFQIPRDLFEETAIKLYAIASKLAEFAQKHVRYAPFQIIENTFLKVEKTFREARIAALWQNADLSELSQVYRNVVVTSQKIIQIVLDSAADFLREISQYSVPGINEAKVAEIYHKIRLALVEMTEKMANNLEAFFIPLMENFKTIQLKFPSGQVMTVTEIQEHVQNALKNLLNIIADVMKQMENPEAFLEKLGQVLQEAVDKVKEFVANTNITILEDILAPINILYKRVLMGINEAFQVIVFVIVIPVTQFLSEIFTKFQEVVNANGVQEFELPLPLLK
ncbi:hypothetical protein DNTS_007902 [Danionella cerebrum]|uniref:Vitellogenin domain-containing protein n=1 Tax=Danionella cerebrum TaxID=2873325 RepID=A0A553RBP1_9TELE|nr:hypothetical protein DNTS_007902 [Danionella translucida]